MTQKRLFSVLIFIVFVGLIYGQTQNQRDASGRKQGYWEATDSKGRLVYAGYFEDDKPVGEMKRYYPTGEVRVILNYDRQTPKVRARFFRQNGEPAAQGNYTGTQRDSVWLYYSNITQTVSHRVEYDAGKHHGKEQSFYPDGNLAEEILWKDGLKNGVWTQYFSNGQQKTAAAYLNDKLEGAYKVFYPDGKTMVEGAYRQDIPDGDWKRYDENGHQVSIIRYARGNIINAEELEAAEQEFFRKVMEQEGRIPEPAVEDLMRETQ